MSVTRRDFFKLAGGGMAASALGPSPAEAAGRDPDLAGTERTATVCPYCSVGCGMEVFRRGGEVVHVQGDPDHPINRGALCPKGASVRQLRDAPNRVTVPLYRAPGADRWTEVSWDWAIGQIADRIKKTRDTSFEETNDAGLTVRRTRAMASVGSAALDNEEAYLLQKLLRGLGLVYIEHQARL